MTLSLHCANATQTATYAAGPVGVTAFSRLRTLPQRAVAIEEGFLSRWQVRNAKASLGHCIDNLERSGVLHNFRRVADGEPGDFQGMWFADSDLYKTLEAIGWESARQGLQVEAKFTAQALELIERTQDPDGYLNTYVQGDPSKSRWSNLVWSHELYCAGHLFQAAVALARGTGDRRLLAVAERFFERIAEDLHDREDGFDGHAEVETALVELYRLTGNRRFLTFADTQIHRRGHQRLPRDRFSREYFGDHEPIETVSEASGHAVRQLYFIAGVTDVYLETGDATLLQAAQRIWHSAYLEKTYLTGGQGSRHTDEAFGDAYELPSDRAYAETCAGIASFQWNWRMLLATGEARFAEAMETVLYNTVAAAVGIDGTSFFYTNPLQLRSDHLGSTENSPSGRLSWFACACCPPNLSRLISALQDYLITVNADGLQVQHLAPASVHTTLGSHEVDLRITTGFPWRGGASIEVRSDAGTEVAIRIPTSAHAVSATLDDGTVLELGADGYIRVNVDWSTGRTISIDFELLPKVVHPNSRIDGIRGTVALRRGPFVYCIEDADQPDGLFEDLRIDAGGRIEETASKAPEVAVALRVSGALLRSDEALYRDADSGPAVYEQRDLIAIPYFAWGNRGARAMRVWIPTADRPQVDDLTC